MNRRTLLVLVLAIVFGSVAAYSAFRYLQDRPTPLIASEADVRVQPVVVAARDVPLGTTLGEEDLAVIDWPAGALPAGFATSVPEVLGRSVVDDLDENEPILAAKLADSGLHGMIPLIPEGMRALSVRVNDVVGVAGFVTPQTRVDVILIMEGPSGEEQSRVILQNIQALAANQQITESEDGQPIVSTVVTVLVSPEQAEKLSLAASQGQIQMALRNTLDLDEIETRGERRSGLFASTPRATPSRTVTRTSSQPATQSIIEVYRAGQRTLISY